MTKTLLLTLLLTCSFTALHAQDICIEVYNDQNGNGMMEDTETGMAEIDLALTSAPASFIEPLPYAMVTDASGISCLNNLSSGSYGFMVNLPEGYAVTNQSGASFIMEINDAEVVNSYRIGLTNQLAAPAYEKAAFSVYPNPAAENLTFKTEEGGEVEIYNVTGIKVMSSTISKSNKLIDVSGLANGMYFAQLNAGKKTETLKFIVSH